MIINEYLKDEFLEIKEEYIKLLKFMKDNELTKEQVIDLLA